MNRRLLIVPVLGASVFAGSQLLAGGDTDLPPEPVFPTVVGSPNDQDWTTDGWSVNRFVDDPFHPSFANDASPGSGAPPATGPSPEATPTTDAPGEVGAEVESPPAVDSTTIPPATVSSPTTTTTRPPTTTTTIASTPTPGGADVPAIDDLPGPDADTDR